MMWLRTAASRIRGLFGKSQLDAELDEELRFHLEMETEENLRQGMSPQEAARRARIRLGGMEQVKEAYRDRRGIPLIESVLQDLRFAGRSFRRDPGFTATVLVTLAFGIGVGTAVFSIVNAVLLKPMPYREPDRVVMLWSHSDAHGRDLASVKASGASLWASDFIALKQGSSSFENMAAFRVYGGYIVDQEGEEHFMRAFSVSEGFFETLGVEPLWGRRFSAEEYRQDAPVMILQHETWRTRFGSDPDILGKQINLQWSTRTVIGVMPPGFSLYDRTAEFLAPLNLNSWLDRRNEPPFTVVARLRDGVSASEAQTEAVLIIRQLAQQHPDLPSNRSLAVIPVSEDATGDLREALFVLLAAVAVVMFVVCLNTANLLLGRAASRRREMAIRTAVGGSRLRIVRQLLTESLLLALMGGGSGFALAHVIVRYYQAIVPDAGGWGKHLVQADWIEIDATTAVFALGISVAAGLIFGIAPAWRAARTDSNAALKGSGTGGAVGQWKIRSALVALETALAVLLVCSAGLLVRSFVALYGAGPGFDPDNRIQLMVYQRNVFTAEQQHELDEVSDRSERIRVEREAIALRNRMLIDRVRAIPGVRDAAITGSIMNHGGQSLYIWPYRNGLPVDEPCQASYRYVSPNFFELMQIPLLEGSTFDGGDHSEAKPMVVSPQFIKSCLSGQASIVGKQVQYGGERLSGPTHRIVGVVGDLYENGIDKDPVPLIYLPISQSRRTSFHVIVRSASAPEALVPAIKNAVREVDSGELSTRFGEARTLNDLVRDSAWRLNYTTTTVGALAGLSLLLSAVGVYGVLSHAVQGRTREIGLRMALGAERYKVETMILREGATPVLVGLALGLVAAAAVTRFLGGLLYGVRPLDPLTFALVAAVTLAAALLASYLPARRASRLDPMAALRCE